VNTATGPRVNLLIHNVLDKLVSLFTLFV
jgi:hypothetical protein